MSNQTPQFSEAAIFSRLVQADRKDDLSPELARQILSLMISESDRQRVHELLDKAKSGELTLEEQKQLDNLNHIADLFSLWHSKARRVLKKSS